MLEPVRFNDLPALAQHLRNELENKKFILLYAYNGVGKTRLSTEFKNLGKDAEDADKRDTLYFNAFTEDLFTWDNDLEGDTERSLKINADSKFFAGLEELEMDNRIRPLLNRYVDFDFRIDTDMLEVVFSREVLDGEGRRTEDDIKVSRGEENIFIWCFFLAIVQLALDGAEAYAWVKYIYIDDPISSLDEQNAIAVATHLARMLKKEDSTLKTVISTHHTLFFNVLFNELKRARKYFLCRDRATGGYVLRNTGRYAILPSRGGADRTLRGGAQRGTLHASLQHAPRDHGKDGQLSRPRELLRLHQTTRRRYRRRPAHPNRQPAQPRQLFAI